MTEITVMYASGSDASGELSVQKKSPGGYDPEPYTISSSRIPDFAFNCNQRCYV